MSQVSLHLDFETASEIDLKERGLDNYAKHPSTRVLMMAWAVNDALPEVWFPHEKPFPEHLEFMIRKSEIQKHAFNSEFERTILREVLHIETPFEVWADPMINARYASIAGDLAFVGKVLGLEEDEAKIATGKKLISFFCKPNKKGIYKDHLSHPDKWAQFVEYCKQDVIAERAIGRKLKAFSLPSFEKKILKIDNDINWRGIPVDMNFVGKASAIAEQENNEKTAEFIALTALANPNSRTQLLPWLKKEGYPYDSLAAPLITRLLETPTGMSEAGIKALKLRQVLAKSSTAKLDAIRNFVSSDGCLRNQYAFGGAARTLRWAGRAVQLQNLPRPTIKDIQGAVKAILTGDINEVRKFGPPLEVIASCLRSAFRAPEGYKFTVCDLSSIEVVGVGWVAECPSILEVFEQKRDAYIDFGTHMWHVSYDDLSPKTKGISEEEKAARKDKRQMLKPAVLGCGYGLGGGDLEWDNKVGDMVRTGLWGYAQNMSVELTREFSHECVAAYRNKYTEVTTAWRKLEKAAIRAVQTGTEQTTNKVTFGCVGKLLYCNLPSGRRLHYVRPQIDEEIRTNRNGEEYVAYKLSYEGMTLNKTWGHNWTWGGKIIENIVQAISRDFLACGMLNATQEGMTIVGHTHDELICLEKVTSDKALDKLRDCMIRRPSWGEDVPLDAAGFEDVIYRKD